MKHSTKSRSTPRLKPINQCRTVAELLASPERWCQDVPARLVSGKGVGSDCPRAVRFCLIGAIYRVYGEGIPSSEGSAAVEVVKDKFMQSQHLGRYTIAPWNDTEGRTHAQVIAAVRKAGI